MAFDIAKEHLRKAGLEDRIYEFEVSSATVELAAQAVSRPASPRRYLLWRTRRLCS